MTNRRLLVGIDFFVDEIDLGIVAMRNWYDHDGYVRTGKPINRERYLHRILTGYKEVDHKDRNPRNNKRSNLIDSTHQQNANNRGMFINNTSGYKGVSYHKGKWQASCRRDGKLYYLGRYETPELAYRAYLNFKGSD